MPLLVLVRHGPTALNAEGRLRGWIDPPLNAEGRQLAGSLRVPSLPCWSSDLRRASETAELMGLVPRCTPQLRPWNVGIFAGQPTAVVHPRLVRYQVQYPDSPVPFGESWDAFVERTARFVGSLLEDCVLVTHFRNCKLIQSLRPDGSVNMDVMLRDDYNPCRISEVRV